MRSNESCLSLLSENTLLEVLGRQQVVLVAEFTELQRWSISCPDFELKMGNVHAFSQMLAELSLEWLGAAHNSLWERSAASTLLTLESATMQRCLNAEAVWVRQLLLVFIPECQLLVPNTWGLWEPFAAWHVNRAASSEVKNTQKNHIKKRSFSIWMWCTCFWMLPVCCAHFYADGRAEICQCRLGVTHQWQLQCDGHRISLASNSSSAWYACEPKWVQESKHSLHNEYNHQQDIFFFLVLGSPVKRLSAPSWPNGKLVWRLGRHPDDGWQSYRFPGKLAEVGSVPEQNFQGQVVSGVDWGGDLMRKHWLTYVRSWTSLRELRGFHRKEKSCKPATQEYKPFQSWDNV